MTWNMAGDRALPRTDATANEGHYLTAEELAARWRVSPRTLERWRARRAGPAWVRLPGRVIYHIEDVRAYERAQLEAPQEAER